MTEPFLLKQNGYIEKAEIRYIQPDRKGALLVYTPISQKFCRAIVYLSLGLLLLATIVLLPLGIYLIQSPFVILKLLGICFMIAGTYTGITLLRVLISR